MAQLLNSVLNTTAIAPQDMQIGFNAAVPQCSVVKFQNCLNQAQFVLMSALDLVVRALFPPVIYNVKRC